MSYNKTNWQTGDIVTAEKLNNIENGIDSMSKNALIISLDDNDSDTLSVSYNDIHSAVQNGTTLYLAETGESQIGDDPNNNGSVTSYGLVASIDFVTMVMDGVPIYGVQMWGYSPAGMISATYVTGYAQTPDEMLTIGTPEGQSEDPNNIVQ